MANYFKNGLKVCADLIEAHIQFDLRKGIDFGTSEVITETGRIIPVKFNTKADANLVKSLLTN